MRRSMTTLFIDAQQVILNENQRFNIKDRKD